MEPNKLVTKILLKLEEELSHEQSSKIAPGHYRGSEIGYCPRAIQYKALGYTAEPKSGENLALLADGHLHEESVRNLFRKIGTVTNVQTNVSKKYKHKGQIFHATGTLDFIFNREIVVDVKGITTFFFQAIDKKWPHDFEAYIFQVMLYMDILGLKDAIIAFKDKNNSELCFKGVEYNEFTMHRILDKMAEIHSMIKQKKFIKRPYEKNSWQCKNCQYRQVCRGKAMERKPWRGRFASPEDALETKLRASLDQTLKKGSESK